jgi:hypothetical protein
MSIELNNLVDIQTPVLNWLNRRVRYVESDENWDWVIQDPVVRRFTAILFIMDRQGVISLHRQTRRKMAQIYLGNKARWMKRENRLKQVLSAFRQSGIVAIPLKGAALVYPVYKDIGLRPMSDVDLLVRSNYFVQAVNTLRQLGFEISSKVSFKSIASLEKLPKVYWPNELSFYDPQGLIIDLHQSLINPWYQPGYPLNIDAIWERSIISSGIDQNVEKGGENLWERFLSPYDTLAHLCLHLAINGLQFPQGILDVDIMIRNLPDTWEWERFLNVVNQWQIRSTTYHALSLCRDFMETPLPDSIFKHLDPGWLARFRVKVLISSKSILADRPSIGKQYPTLVILALIDRLPFIFITIIKMIFPDKGWRDHNLSGRSILGHWLNVFRIVKRGY